MTTIINSTPSDEKGSGLIVGLVVFVGLIVFLVYFGLPILRQSQASELKLPITQVNVPEKVDINISQQKGVK